MSLKLQARRAYAHSCRLSGPALFVLMQCGSVPKGDRSRAFHLRWLQTASTLNPLRQAGVSLRQVLDELSQNGMMRRVGRTHVVCTAEGDLTKHCFNDLWAECRVQGVFAPLSSDKMARIDGLRLVMRSYIAGKSWATIRDEVQSPK